jgi:hypothetical protein
MGLIYNSVTDTEMRMELWGGNLGRHVRMLENNMIKILGKGLGEYKVYGISK